MADMRPKFPKLQMIKSMQRRENNVDDHQNKLSKTRDYIRKRISLMILRGCSSKKAQEMSSSEKLRVEKANSGASNCHKNRDETIAKKQSHVKMPTKISRLIRSRLGFPIRKLKLDGKISNGGGDNAKDWSKNVDETRPVIKAVYRRSRSETKRLREKLVIPDGKEKEQQGTNGMELCKKRILMGEKCRPLNLSGALHYDKDGVLLAEEVI